MIRRYMDNKITINNPILSLAASGGRWIYDPDVGVSIIKTYSISNKGSISSNGPFASDYIKSEDISLIDYRVIDSPTSGPIWGDLTVSPRSSDELFVYTTPYSGGGGVGISLYQLEHNKQKYFFAICNMTDYSESKSIYQYINEWGFGGCNIIKSSSGKITYSDIVIFID